MLPKINKNSAGFTVMELVVVLGVFSIVVILVTDIFFIITRSQRSLVASQAVQRDMRFVMESIAKDVQQGLIDYDYYQSQVPTIDLKDPLTGQVLAQSVLALLDNTGRTVRYRFVEAQAGQPASLEISRGSSGTWDPLLSDDVILVAVRFYIVPSANPFLDSSSTNKQPRITITLSGQAIPTLGTSLPATFFLQTTALTRSYLR
ncbi:type II secretion system GspH family protein [Patescibacteria group bacterium]|nr:type II secretion system GspH family protein [Patescibacteria group bacterium]